jgi:hypothetical protein
MEKRIEIDSFIEKEYDLSDLGLKNHLICVEKSIIYLENTDTGLFIIINSLEQLICKGNNYILFDKEDINTTISLSKGQHNIIKELLTNAIQHQRDQSVN